MGLISAEDRETLQKHFDQSLGGDVEIVMFTERPSPIIIPGKQPCETCSQTEELLEEVASLSDKLKLTVHELSAAKEQAFALGINCVPAFIFKGASRGNVRFFGIPSGYEFSALIADLVDVSNGTTDLSNETRQYLTTLTEPVNIKVFTTPTCPYCPAAARLAHQMAVESEHVTGDVIEAMEFPDLARRYSVRGVPKIVINETTEFVGALPEAEYLAQLRAATEANGSSNPN